MNARLASLLAALALAVPALAGTAQAQGSAGGGTISCTSDLPAYGPLNVSQTMGAGTSGALTLGGDNNKFIGTCTLVGTIPSGWTVDETSGAALSAAGGAGNDGTFKWDSNEDDASFADSGTFTNAGTFADGASGFTQQIEVADFVNTGTVLSGSPTFELGGTGTFDDHGIVDVSSGASFALAGTFLLEAGGTIKAGGAFDVAGSTFDVRGGSVTSGVLTSPYHLGVGATTIEFAAGLPASSKGTIQVGVPAALTGVVPKGWALDLSSGITASPGAGNAGTIEWAAGAGNSTFADSSTFVNSGTFADDATGLSQQITAKRFVNTGTVRSHAPGFAVGGTSPTFDDRGTVIVDPKASFGTGGTFVLDRGGSIQTRGSFDIAGATLDVDGGSVTRGILVSPYHLGVGTTRIVFAASLPASSKGIIDVQVPITVTGTVSKSWTLKLDGGRIVR